MYVQKKLAYSDDVAKNGGAHCFAETKTKKSFRLH